MGPLGRVVNRDLSPAPFPLHGEGEWKVSVEQAIVNSDHDILTSIRDQDLTGFLYTDFTEVFRSFTESSVYSAYPKVLIPNSGYSRLLR